VSPDQAIASVTTVPSDLEGLSEVLTMVTVTERAKEKLKELLQGETDDPSLSLRLATAAVR
jgi:hypothetical protein